MLVVFLIICVGTTVFASDLFLDIDIGLIIGTLFSVICFIAIIILICFVATGTVIDEKIELYETTNQQIDEQIKEMVLAYKEYESDTFDKINNKNAETLITLFPELKTDSLVKTQMEIYMTNKQKILQLKEDKINLKPAKWWLYFGG